ncbi:MAG: glycoside hydrolase family 140 protein, partial [Chloroflexota bacterium]|nr:glycoside hydrolase family 140 protein [Chloroflexota bacterium]
YGANGVFQFWSPQQEDRFGVRRPWQEGIALPGSAQMQHARRLLESRPFLSRIPDQSLLLSGEGAHADHSRATRAEDGAYALVYSASGHPVTVDLRKLSGDTATAHWYDPRQGTARSMGQFAADRDHEFTPPYSGESNDWVLVLDDASKGFQAPGVA